MKCSLNFLLSYLRGGICGPCSIHKTVSKKMSNLVNDINWVYYITYNSLVNIKELYTVKVYR